MILLALAIFATNPPGVTSVIGAANQGYTGPSVLAANPQSLASVIASARPGDTVRLVDGRYAMVTIKGRTFEPPLTIDASAASVAGVKVVDSTGIRWTGGTLKGNPGDTALANYGFLAIASRAVVIDGVHIGDYRVGIVFDHVTGGAITGNWLVRMTSDGADLAGSRNIAIAHNTCSDFAPAEGAHPDCIQIWSVSDAPPSADITVTANTIVGSTQGISLFNTVHDGIDPGGYDRITISGNTVLNIYGNGITVLGCRSCSVRNNSVGSLPNYFNRAQLYVTGGSVDQCGNVVTMVPRQSTPPCTN